MSHSGSASLTIRFIPKNEGQFSMLDGPVDRVVQPRDKLALGMSFKTLHLFIGVVAGFFTASVLLLLLYLCLRKRDDTKPLGKKKSKVRISLSSIKSGTATNNSEESLLHDSEQPDLENPKCHDCRKISTPEHPCKCDIDIWENYVQEKPCMLQFSLYYNYHNSHLLVHIICAVNVAQKSWHGKYPSTRVRFQLLPSTECYQTEVKANTSEPMFNETFDFIGYSQSELQDLKLLMGLYAYDRFSRKKMLGFLELPFDTVSWDASHPVILWQNVEREAEMGRGRSISAFSKGEVQFSLRYDARASRLNVVILKATNLPRVRQFRGAGFYVTATLMDEDHEVQIQNTKKKRSHSPVWNKGFLFEVDPERFEAHANIIVKVMNHDLLFTDEVIGEVTVGPKEGESGRKHWQEMIKKKHVHREVAITHALE